MNNQEKARQLQLDCIKNGCGDSTDIRCACEEMAEWKDQQFKEYLMMKRRKLKNEHVGFLLATAQVGKICCIDEIMEELFKEEKK